MKKNIIINIIALSLLAACTSKLDFTTPSTPVTPPVTGNTDLIISELSAAINTYTGPTGLKNRNHYVELWNGTLKSIDLSDYAIGYQPISDTNSKPGWSFPSGNFIVLKGILSTSKAYVIASPIADTALVLVKSDTTWGTTSSAASDASSPLQLSGNSAIALLKKDTSGLYSLAGITYKIIDVFCSPSVSRIAFTGTQSARNNIYWSVGDTTSDTRNRTFKRKTTITGPQSDWNIANAAGNSQWLVSGDKKWDYTNIGLPTVN
jgi:hypothetical protein